jgi:hypothetical protein
MAAPDAWDEVALINVNDGVTDMNIACMTETIDIDLGDKDGESIPNLCGGRIFKKTPEPDTTITFEGYPISIGKKTDTAPTGLIQFFFGGTDSTQPLSVISGKLRPLFRVTIMWTDDPAALTARSGVTSGYYALRYDFQNCLFISCKPSFTDKILKATWKFKCPAFNKAGTGNMTFQSTEGTASMTTI